MVRARSAREPVESGHVPFFSTLDAERYPSWPRSATGGRSRPRATPSPTGCARSSTASSPRPSPVTRHVAFGHGVHHCLGAALARAELRIALPALVNRFPTLALADPDAPVDFRSFAIVYAVRSLPVVW